MNKKCFKCGDIKNINCFYKHSQMGDGYLNKCIECAKKDVKLYRTTSIGRKKLKIYEKKRNKTKKRKLQRYNQTINNRKKYPEKNRARYLVQKALKSGKLIKKPCYICGNKNSQAHHEDYSKPLDVVWLCFKHHRERDLEIINKINV